MEKAYSRSTFTLENNTYLDIIDTRLSEIDNYDWHGDERPDRNFAGAKIPAGSQKTETEDMTADATGCPFTMTLTFKDGSQDTFRIHQKFAYGSDSKFWAKSGYREYGHNKNEKNRSVWVTIADKAGVKDRNEAKSFFLKGKIYWDDGWTIEKARGFNLQSNIKFGLAKHEFGNAKDMYGIDEYKKYHSLAIIKLEGNNVVDSAYQQKTHANELCSEAAEIQSNPGQKQEAITLFRDSINQFRNAKIDYSAAEKKFQNGLMLGENFFNESIIEIQKISAYIDNITHSIEITVNRLG